MFDLKSMGAIASLMKDREKLKAAGEKLKVRIEALEVDGAAGGGVCRARVSGTMKVISVRLDDALATGLGANADAREMGERLIAEAINDALVRAQQEVRAMVEAEMRELGLDGLVGKLPGLPGLPG
ncbi:MAG: YbaB/EbfC family nucleoid-associated protein [Planctomycetota bacterium]